MPITLDYVLDDGGWADITLGNEQQSVTGAVSNLHDSLASLADAALDLLTGRRIAASVFFMDEPGEHHLLLTTTDEDSSALQIEVRWFDDWASWGIYPDDQFELLLSAGSSKKEFGKEVLRVLTKIWLQHGEEGYRKKWLRHSFPSQQHTQLQRLLNA